jgi:malate synthase
MHRVEVAAPLVGRAADALSPAALDFVGRLHRRFDGTRQWLLKARAERRARLSAGGSLDFLASTRGVREADWTVPPPPDDLRDRRVEITGPAERKMMINALNSGANAFMADLEDSLSPTWANVTAAQVNLIDAVAGTIDFEGPDGRSYALDQDPAVLIVRPRGWHLFDRHVLVDGRPVSASLLDFGVFAFNNARAQLERGSGPYLYLPKLESHLEARLWNDVLLAAQDELGLDPGRIRATVLIETVPAVFEMDEILHELGQHALGLNAGRWDYIFSMIKCFRERPEFVLPDRGAVTMTVPFMRAYTELLVRTCHRRGAHAMGGMAALIPSRTDPEANARAVAGVRVDKAREAGDGFDGTWVAHPDLVAVAREEFDAVLGERANQVDRRRDDVAVGPADLLDAASAGGRDGVTEGGLRNDVGVGLQYISSWLRGNGAAAIHGLMEDAATAEIARSQVWQWIRHGVALTSGETIGPELVRGVVGEESERADVDPAARAIFELAALNGDYPEFLTLPAYERLPEPARGPD